MLKSALDFTLPGKPVEVDLPLLLNVVSREWGRKELYWFWLFEGSNRNWQLIQWYAPLWTPPASNLVELLVLVIQESERRYWNQW